MEVEEGRAAVYELDLAVGESRIFASGLRNPVGLAWEPQTGVLWTVGQRARWLGDETPPDYLTRSAMEVSMAGLIAIGEDRGRSGAAGSGPGRQGDHAGLCAGRPHRIARSMLAAGRHASGLSGRHGPSGSTAPGNRSTLSGYKVVFVPFANGRPSGPPRDILSGFLAPTSASPMDARSA